MKRNKAYELIGSVQDNIEEILSMALLHLDDDTRRQSGFSSSHKDTRAVLLQFNWDYCSRDRKQPLYDKFYPLLIPLFRLLEEHFDFDNFKTWKMLIAELKPNGEIKIHSDTHYSFDSTHRCHWILQTNKDVKFSIGDETLPTNISEVYEIDNVGREHKVFNGGITPRYHMIIDVYDDK